MPQLFPLMVILMTGQAPVASQPRELPVEGRVLVRTFINLSGNTADDWIGAGIAETVATRVGADPGIVVTRDEGSGSQRVAGEAIPSQDVDYMLTGTYQRIGERIRLTARLIDLGDASIMRSTTVDGLADELFDLQDQLINTITPLLAGVGPRARSAATRGDRPSATRPPGAPVEPKTVSDTRRTAEFAAPSFTGVIDGPPPPIAPLTISRDAEGRATVRAVQLETPLRLDGTLDEGIYESVQPFSGFVQQQPDEGAPATEQTDVWVFFDTRNVYVAGRIWDSAPESRWIANEMQRDSFQLIQNEGFSVVLDTFYDRRNGVVFSVNPIGGFMDQQITDEGQPNMDWNPVWDARTGRFPGGWTVEMEIPFKSLRFPAGELQVWGLQVGRRIRWKNEWAYLTPVPISAGPGTFRISVAATLTGIEVPRGNRTFEIKPYAIGSLATDLNASPQISNQGDGAFGVDAKYGVTQNLVADLTYNTDFAQVEVDEQQVNLTRFSLFFPEKREFFLEGRGIFDFGTGARFGGGGGAADDRARTRSSEVAMPPRCSSAVVSGWRADKRCRFAGVDDSPAKLVTSPSAPSTSRPTTHLGWRPWPPTSRYCG
ncbi:MAG: DUF5916 domain-containing protein [Acidobacteriota bacterium]|nr:DUF5916 domain-containing protein [Acidobacteriota bacterium]